MRTYLILLCFIFASIHVLPAQGAEKQAPLKVSLVKWSFRTTTSRLCEHARTLGVDAIEIVDEEKWPVIKQYGMNIPVVDGADLGVWAGFCNEELHERLQKRYSEILPKLKQYEITKLICYSGINTRVDDCEALEICARGLLPVVREAEKYGVTLVMELLSSRETDALFGKQRFAHYRCDNPEWGVELCEKIGSSNFRLLYDVWHMADMKRDVPADIARYSKYIAHYHIADRKKRNGTFSDDDRAFYQKVFREIGKSGYNGYIGLEFDRIGHDILKLLQSSVKFVNDMQK